MNEIKKSNSICVSLNSLLEDEFRRGIKKGELFVVLYINTGLFHQVSPCRESVSLLFKLTFSLSR